MEGLVTHWPSLLCLLAFSLGGLGHRWGCWTVATWWWACSIYVQMHVFDSRSALMIILHHKLCGAIRIKFWSGQRHKRSVCTVIHWKKMLHVLLHNYAWSATKSMCSLWWHVHMNCLFFAVASPPCWWPTGNNSRLVRKWTDASLLRLTRHHGHTHSQWCISKGQWTYHMWPNLPIVVLIAM